MEKARRRVKERDDEIHDLRQQRGLMDKRMSELQKDLAKAEQELAALRKAGETSEEQIHKLRSEIEGRNSELEKTRTGQKTARVDAKRLQLEMGILESKTKEEIEAARKEAEAKVKVINGTLSSALASLEATREALEAVGVSRPQSELGTGRAPELASVLAKVPAPQRKELEKELVGHIDRESLKRYAGPHVKWIRPDSASKRVEELTALRTRGERVDLALNMDVDP